MGYLQHMSPCNTTTSLASNTTMIVANNTTMTVANNTTMIVASNTTTPVATNAPADLQLVRLVLFSLAVLLDVLYVLLFSRNFIRRSPGRLRSRSPLREEKTSHLVGTVGIDLHVVLACVHLFGVLCQVGVVEVSEDTMLTFTVVVGVLSVGVYFLDAVLFALIKKLFCVSVCFVDGPSEGADTGDSSSEYAQSFLDRT